MDPYLERPGLWTEVHTGLISAIQRYLTPVLRPRYRIAVERHTYLAVLPPHLLGRPDISLVQASDVPRFRSSMAATAMANAAISPQVVQLPMPEEVIERYLVILDVVTAEVITVMELLSPTNKLSKSAREQYERKRLDILSSRTNLVEIDLLGDGEPIEFLGPGRGEQSDYRIIVSRAEERPNADAYLFTVRDRIPDVPMPLRPKETEPLLPLNQVLHTLYDEAGYDLAVDYSQAPEPPLSSEADTWAKTLFRKN